jgi:hypothetical protein
VTNVPASRRLEFGGQVQLGVRRRIQLFSEHGAQVLLDFAGICTAPIR